MNSLSQCNSDERPRRSCTARWRWSVVNIATSVITHKGTGTSACLYAAAAAQFCYSSVRLHLQWLLNSKGQSELHNYRIRQIQQFHKCKANFTDYFPTFYSNFGIPHISFPITVSLKANLLASHYENIFQIHPTLSFGADGDRWIRLSSVMVATDHLLVPPG